VTPSICSLRRLTLAASWLAFFSEAGPEPARAAFRAGFFFDVFLRAAICGWTFAGLRGAAG
jgi:hypothetical protein